MLWRSVNLGRLREEIIECRRRFIREGTGGRAKKRRMRHTLREFRLRTAMRDYDTGNRQAITDVSGRMSSPGGSRNRRHDRKSGSRERLPDKEMAGIGDHRWERKRPLKLIRNRHAQVIGRAARDA